MTDTTPDTEQTLDEPNTSLWLFGRDVSKIPCFRKSFLYGISSGCAVGVLAFMCTSKPMFGSHVGIGTYMATTFGFFCYCRYNWSKDKLLSEQMQQAIQMQTMYKGTDLERAIQTDEA